MSADSQSRQKTCNVPSGLRSIFLTSPKASHHLTTFSYLLRFSFAFQSVSRPSSASSNGTPVITSFLSRRLEPFLKGNDAKNDCERCCGDTKNDAVGVPGEGRGRVGSGGGEVGGVGGLWCCS